MSQKSDGGVWTLVIIVFCVSLIISAFTTKTMTTSAPTTYSPNTDSFEYRYAKERVKMEGYSDREAAQAADAIVRFHEAQKARQR